MRIRQFRLIVKPAALAILLAFPAQQALAAPCTWNPASGDWSTAGLWSCGVIPGAADSASIAAAKTVTITLGNSILTLSNAGQINIDAFGLNLVGGGSTTNTGVINVGGPSTANLGISAGHNINNTGGTMNVGSGSVINQFGSTITGGTINTTGTGKLVAFNSNSNILNGVTLNGTLDLATGTGIERVTGGLTLNGTVNINNNSVLSFGGDQTLGGTGTIVLGNTGASNRALSMEGNTVLTVGSNIVVRGENGTIGQAYLSGGTQSLINNGRISADVSGGTFNLAPSHGVTNNGVLEAKNGGTLVLNANVTGTVGSHIDVGAGSTILQNGVGLNGVINTAGGGSFRAANSNSNTLTAATFNGTLDLATGTGIERVTGGLTLNGTVNINNNSVLSFGGDQTLGGTGTIVLGNTGASNRALSMEGNTVLTVGSNIVVRGENGTIGQVYLSGGTQSLINDGRISADVSGGTFNLAPSHGVTNNGVLEAKNGGTLVLNANVTGTVGSHIDVGAGSTILQNGVGLNGVINSAGGGSFRAANSNSNTLTAATFNGTLDLATGTGIERVTGGLTLNGTVNINNNSVLSFGGDQTLGGTGTIVLGNTGASNRALSMEGNTVLTVGSNIVVRGENGTIGQVYLSGGTQSLINDGRISADVSGGTFNLAPSHGVTNNGVLEAKNGGTLVLNSNVIGQVGSSINAGAGSTVLQNGVTLSGVINSAGTGNFRVANSNSNFLDGVTFNGPLDMASATSIERVVNGLTLNGTINVNTNSVLSFSGNQTLGGNGTIVLGNTGASNRALALEGNTVLTIGSNVVVRGENGTVGQVYLSGGTQQITNNGSILADVGGGTVALATGLTLNNALLGAANGGTLRLDGTVTQAGAGQINAATGSTVIQNGVTITGGAINSAGTGRLVATNNNSNFLSGVTLGGLLDLASGTGIERVTNGLTLNGGSVNVNSNSVLSFRGDQTLGGTGSIVLGNTGASNRALSLEGNITLTIASGVTVRGTSGTIGQTYLSGGTQSIINNGTINSDSGGTINLATTSGITNNGTLRAQSGTLNVGNNLIGTGTLRVDAGGSMNLANGGNTQGQLVMGAAGSAISIGTGNLTITNDYTNAGAGTGNAFNRRSGVTGTGQIVAGGNAAQAITGTGVTGGNTTNATLTIGNMRVGANTFNYQLANTGTTGPTLRGAIQTNVNGGNITDARLSGTGVTASNYNAGGPNGNSGNLGVTFTAASAGAQAALSGQAINLRSNFDNIADQKLNIVLAGGAAAYNAAAGSAAPSPVVVANQRVGGSNSQVLTVSNTAAAGAFSEDLRATFGSNGGAALNNGGSVVSLIAGGNNVSAMTARVDTSTAGAKTGSVTLNYETLGTVNGVSNGLGTASAGSQTINVSGNVYRLAQGDTTPLAANFGNRHVGDSVSQTLTIKNLSVNDGFSEKLNASFGTNSGNATNNGGSVNLLAAGGSNAASMSVGMDTSSVGNKSGSVAVNYQSDGAGTSGLSSISAGSQTVNVSGSVYRLAQANTLGAVSFGNVHVGDSVQQALSISNTAANDGFSEKLNASFGNATDARITNNGGSISQLAAGATNSSMVVGLNTAAAGTVNGSIAVNFASDGAGTSGLGISALATQNVGVSGNITTQGNVYRLASASPATPNPVNFGNVRINTATDQALTIGNTAANDGFSEKLNASISSNGAPVTASGSFNLLGPQASDNSSLHVGIDTSSAGAKSGSATIALVSDGAGTSGLGQTSLASQTVNVNGAVYRLANPQSVTSSLTLAARVGGSASGNVSITNQSPDIYTEALKVVAGAAPSSLFNIGSNPANIAAQGTGTVQVSLNTGTAGSSTGTLTLNNTSTGAGTTNAADVSVGTSNVTLTGKVYTAAQATVQPAVNFGIVHVNEVVAVRGVSVQNSAPVTALNDTLAASIGGATGSFSSNNGSVAGLAAGGPANTTALTVGVNTATAGIFNGTANLALASQNPDMADLGLGSRSVALSAQVNKYANAEFGKVTGAGALTRNGSVFTLNFGTWVQGSGLLSAILDVDNLVNGGPADDLNGSLNIVDGNDFFASLLLASFSNVGADASSGDALSFLFDTNALALGSYQDSVALTWFGTNGSGYRDANDHFYTLQVIGTIVQQGANVPEPNSLLLLTVALLAGLGVSRRRHSV